MINSSFLKQCIAEVIVENIDESGRNTHEQTTRLLKECISEVKVELARKKKVYGNPKHLLKECVMEVLKENLMEGYDPQSNAGPNPPQENPYPLWNNRMRQMEEDKGTVAHGRYAQEAGATPLLPTFTEIRNQHDPDGKHHDLRMECAKCGNVETCKCSKPKRTFKGICNKCSTKVAVNETISSEIKWECPHCKKTTGILIEVESPQDYIACADCEHCGHVINDYRLDHRILNEVITCCAGRKLLK